METERRCSFYDSFRNPDGGHMRGYCEFDCAYSDCEGEIGRCGKINVLRGYLMERTWMKTMIEKKGTTHN
jgi:hypothetical protein